MEELRRQIALENQMNEPIIDEPKKEKSETELPSEYECCFCTSKVIYNNYLFIRLFFSISFRN